MQLSILIIGEDFDSDFESDFELDCETDFESDLIFIATMKTKTLQMKIKNSISIDEKDQMNTIKLQNTNWPMRTHCLIFYRSEFRQI